MQKLRRTSAVRLVKMPPFLVLVVSGDSLQAAPAWTAAATVRTSASHTTRYHVNFAKKRYSRPDGILYLQDTKPRFSQPLSPKQDGLSPLKDTVCGQSPIVEEASTQAPLATRRSLEADLGSPAALTLQVDRFIRT